MVLAVGSIRQRLVLSWLAALIAGVLSVTIANRAWRDLPRPQPLEELSYYPSGRHLEVATLGHAQSAADLAWLRAVQYYGAHRLSDNRFPQMAHVLDILTSLAPHFIPAYVFGAFSLEQEGSDFPHAEALMMKGLANNPRSGPLAFQAGFLYYVRPGGRDLRHAAEYFEQAARQPDAPPQATRFAAFARQNGGELAVALELWTDVSRRSSNIYLRQMADREIERIRNAMAVHRPESAITRLATPRLIISHPH